VTEEPDELELWARARASDGDAFARLFDLHRDRVFRRAVGLVGDVHDAEDVTAAAFFELWRRRRSVTPLSGSVLPWLLVTTVNVSRNIRRSTMRYQRLLRAAPRGEPLQGPDAEPIEIRDRLAESLNALSPADSALLVLTSLEGVPIVDAARTLGIKPATARVRLHRIRVRMRTELHDLRPTPLPSEGATS
jgi:RNA polymerase sigma-70 factor (ECF subfamily)